MYRAEDQVEYLLIVLVYLDNHFWIYIYIYIYIYIALCHIQVKLWRKRVAQSCPTLCDPVDCSLPGSSVHGILQARILEWVAISFSRGSSWLRDQTQVSHIAGRCFTLWITKEAPTSDSGLKNSLAVQDTRVWPLVWEDPRSREWQPTPVFFPGILHGQRSLVGCSPCSYKESDMTEHLTNNTKT